MLNEKNLFCTLSLRRIIIEVYWRLDPNYVKCSFFAKKPNAFEVPKISCQLASSVQEDASNLAAAYCCMFRSWVAQPITNVSLFAVEKQMVNDNTHSIHVWYIYLHFPPNVGKYTIHGCYGIFSFSSASRRGIQPSCSTGPSVLGPIDTHDLKLEIHLFFQLIFFGIYVC